MILPLQHSWRLEVSSFLSGTLSCGLVRSRLLSLLDQLPLLQLLLGLHLVQVGAVMAQVGAVMASPSLSVASVRTRRRMAGL